jgi:hypothetical protein
MLGDERGYNRVNLRTITEIPIYVSLKNDKITTAFPVVVDVLLIETKGNKKIRSFRFRPVVRKKDAGWELHFDDAVNARDDPIEVGEYEIEVTVAITGRQTIVFPGLSIEIAPRNVIR